MTEVRFSRLSLHDHTSSLEQDAARCPQRLSKSCGSIVAGLTGSIEERCGFPSATGWSARADVSWQRRCYFHRIKNGRPGTAGAPGEWGRAWRNSNGARPAFQSSEDRRK